MMRTFSATARLRNRQFFSIEALNVAIAELGREILYV
jgi:hypothetical protein